MQEGEQHGLTGREKKIIAAVAVITLILLSAWIFTIIAVMPEPSHGLM